MFWKQVKKFWMAFAEVLGRVQTTIMLSIVYHLAVGPIALFARLTGRDIMTLKPKPEAQSRSYSVELPMVSSTLERAKRQF